VNASTNTRSMSETESSGFGGIEKRKHERIAVSLPISFVCELTHMTYRGTVKNLGLGGVLVETTARLTKMERLTISVAAGPTGTLKIGAVVVRYHRENEAGIAFVAMSRDDQEQLQTLVERYRTSHESPEL